MASDECPLIPMGAITGAPSREFLYERLKNWHSWGVTQFMIYSRSGLELGYLSDEWFERCRWICQDAKSHGFTSIWIYDEMNWPSGTCHGEVLRANPEHAIHALRVTEPHPGQFVFELLRGNQMADLFNPEAVDSFIHLTHERYEKHIGEFFGTLVKGFFTDEPDIARFPELEEQRGYKLLLPYYKGLEEDYLTLTGGALRDDILRGLKTGSEPWTIPCNQLMARKFRSSFSERVSRWCEKRGLVLTGHLMNEFSTNSALMCNGHILQVLSGFSFPGIDDIHTPLDNDTMEYLTYSTGMYAIEKQGNHGGLAELFALGPCDMTLGRMCAQFYLCAAFGINHYVLAVSQTDVRGNLPKPYYFNPMSETQPWHDAFRELGECAREAARWATKQRNYDIAVRYPYAPQPLTDLLQHLADEQFGWKLILPEEETDAPLVLSCENGGILEERTGQFYFHFGVLLKRKLCMLRPKTTVCETDGSQAHGIFLRSFKDGSAMVINLSGKNRELCLNTQEKRIPFHLYPQGVFTYEPGTEEEIKPSPVFELPQDGWDITLDSPNTMRADFNDKGQCEFLLEEELPGLKLVLRNYGQPVRVRLDGREVTASSPCTTLVQGFREIYCQSKEFTLSKGRHVLEVDDNLPDYPYLPTALLVGKFAVDENKRLTQYRNDGRGLYGYVGKIHMKRQLELPSGTAAIQANTLGLVAELSIDGKPLGRRIRDPFTWRIHGYSGTVNVELTICTSCARLFGQEIFIRPDAIALTRDNRPHNETPLLLYTR